MVEAQALFKQIWRSPRLPKPWEAAFNDWQAFEAWVQTVPETTPVSLLPLMWQVRGDMAYQDGGGLNALLKERGLTKRAWKSITAMPLEDTVALFDFHRRLGLNRWIYDLPAAVDAAREAAVPVTAPLVTILMGLRLDLDGMNEPFLSDRIGFIRMLSRHLEKEIPVNLEQFRVDLQQMLDFLDDEGYEFGEATTIPELKEASDTWHQEQLEEAQRVALRGNGIAVAAEEATWNVVPTPGGQNDFVDPVTGMRIVRLHTFAEFQRESQLMGHCIGLSDTYHSRHRNGTGAYYSMRHDGVERPVSTLELVCHNGEWRIAQNRGPSNRDPGADANNLAQRLLDGHRNGVLKEETYEVIFGGQDAYNYNLHDTCSRFF